MLYDKSGNLHNYRYLNLAIPYLNAYGFNTTFTLEANHLI